MSRLLSLCASVAFVPNMAAAGRLSEEERKFVVQGVQQDVRSDGRARLDYRHVTIECGLLPQANGSARLRVVNGSTDIIGAVKVGPTRTWPPSLVLFARVLTRWPTCTRRRRLRSRSRAFPIEAASRCLSSAGRACRLSSLVVVRPM